uniref:Uncharacterized protein n=1 Tax=Trichogramma kaykai TaxID=54128 RepID=A0ABD2WH32_9HYME
MRQVCGSLWDALFAVEREYYRKDVHRSSRTPLAANHRYASRHYDKLPTLPSLVIGDKPVLKLFLYNIPKRQNRAELLHLLHRVVQEGFEISKIDDVVIKLRVRLHAAIW